MRVVFFYFLPYPYFSFILSLFLVPRNCTLISIFTPLSTTLLTHKKGPFVFHSEDLKKAASDTWMLLVLKRQNINIISFLEVILFDILEVLVSAVRDAFASSFVTNNNTVFVHL